MESITNHIKHASLRTSQSVIYACTEPAVTPVVQHSPQITTSLQECEAIPVRSITAETAPSLHEPAAATVVSQGVSTCQAITGGSNTGSQQEGSIYQSSSGAPALPLERISVQQAIIPPANPLEVFCHQSSVVPTVTLDGSSYQSDDCLTKISYCSSDRNKNSPIGASSPKSNASTSRMVI